MELARVFQNLIRNALDAGPDKIEIRFENTDTESIVVVRDNGEGMD